MFQVIPSNNSELANLFMVAVINKSLRQFGGYSNYPTLEKLSNLRIKIPITQNGHPNIFYMNKFVAELEAQRVAELEAYLTASGLMDYELNSEDIKALNQLNHANWGMFNISNLFGKSTRGKRLKGNDRISGSLPFVTAGEADMGISAFIGNDVEVFSANTFTIDMFGSAKYRSYSYGGDDHVAVVHTEDLNKYAAIFVTAAAHKASHTGQFDYGRNFYAKDADALWIRLPEINGKPNYDLMETFVKAVHKLVIKTTVRYTDMKIKATRRVVG